MPANRCFVALRGDTVVVMKPKTELTPQEAVEFAAWLVSIAQAPLQGRAREQFEKAFDAVEAGT
jgi:hypothetical protein